MCLTAICADAICGALTLVIADAPDGDVKYLQLWWFTGHCKVPHVRPLRLQKFGGTALKTLEICSKLRVHVHYFNDLKALYDGLDGLTSLRK